MISIQASFQAGLLTAFLGLSANLCEDDVITFENYTAAKRAKMITTLVFTLY